MSIAETITPTSQSFYPLLPNTENKVNADSVINHVDKACQTEAHLFEPEKESDTSILDDFDFIIKGDFSSFFKKEDKAAKKEFLLCQEKLKSIDRTFLKCAIEGDFHAYSKDELSKKFNYIFDEVVEPLSKTLETINNIEPKPRLLLSVRLSNIMVGIIVTLISASVLFLPALFPSFFVSGTISYGVLYSMDREGSLTLNLSGILLNVYQWIANKRDNDALQEFQNFRDRLTRINTFLDKMRNNAMYKQISQISDQINSQNSQIVELNERINEQTTQVTTNITNQISEIKNAQIRHEEITAADILEIKRQQKEILMHLSRQHYQHDTTTPPSLPSHSKQFNNQPEEATSHLSNGVKIPTDIDAHTYQKPSIM